MQEYTAESDFYKDINKDLRSYKFEKYLPYIKVLYEAIKLKALLPSSDMKYYRAGRLSNDEIILIKKYFNQKKVNSTGVNVFTRAFICFLKSFDVAKCFLNCHLKKKYE